MNISFPGRFRPDCEMIGVWNRVSISAGLAALGILAAIVPGCGHPAGGPVARAEAPAASPAVRVSVVKPEQATIRRITEEPGHIEAIETTPVYAKLAGYVQTVSVDYGDSVKRGQVLAELRVPEIDAELKQKHARVEQAKAGRKQAEAAVEVAQARVASARAQVEQVQAGVRRSEADAARWEAEYARVEQLFRERAQTGSLLDETRSKLHAAEAGRDEVRAQVRAAEATHIEARALLDKARSDLEAAVTLIDVARAESERAEAMSAYTKVVSPFDGIVTRRAVDTGHLTTAGTTGEPLFVIARSDIVTITVGVPEADAALVNPGDRAKIRLQALGDRTFDGAVTRTAWALNPSTRTLHVEIDLPNRDTLLRPGLYAYATIIAEEHRDVLSVPSSAIVLEGGKTYCVLIEGSRARRREVRVGLNDGRRMEIVSGLSEGDAMVGSNPGALEDGQPVEIGESAVPSVKPGT
jgi:RND family efflux transporter MFP subunit